MTCSTIQLCYFSIAGQCKHAQDECLWLLRAVYINNDNYKESNNYINIHTNAHDNCTAGLVVQYRKRIFKTMFIIIVIILGVLPDLYGVSCWGAHI